MEILAADYAKMKNCTKAAVLKAGRDGRLDIVFRDIKKGVKAKGLVIMNEKAETWVPAIRNRKLNNIVKDLGGWDYRTDVMSLEAAERNRDYHMRRQIQPTFQRV